MKHALVFVLCAACGGKLDTGDAGSPGSGSDGSTTPPKDAQGTNDTGTTGSCGPVMTAESTDSTGACQISQSWTCGATQYSAQCDCPKGVCTCSEQTTMMGSGTMVSAGSVCPACSSNLAAVCGFPQ